MATVLGHHDPLQDIPNVQYAVDHYPDVTLKGHFSFNAAPTVPTPLAGYPMATILVSKAVTISGDPGMKIDGGTIPFYVDAPGLSVTIQKLHFDGPISKGITVYAANGVTIANCKFENVALYAAESSAIDIVTVGGGVPLPTNPGIPQNIFGRVVIAGNEIDMGAGTNADSVLGIVVFSVGLLPNNEVDIYIVKNKINNVTEPAINLRHIGGRAVVEGNEIETSSTSGPTSPEAIRAANDGSFVIAHNTIKSQWSDQQAVGIGVFSQISNNPPLTPPWTEKNAVVVCNSVTMSPPPGTMFGPLSAGIDIRGFAHDNVVGHNKIHGSARAAVAVDTFKGGSPGNTAIIHNDVTGFAASAADVVIGTGVTDTVLIDQDGTIQDNGTGTVTV